MRRVAAILALALAVSACRRADVLLFLEADPTMQSAVLVHVVDDEAHVSAHTLVDGALEATLLDPYIGRYDVDVTALFYTRPLASLDLIAGAVQTVPDGRQLPASPRTMQTRIRGEDVTPWEEISALPDAVAAVRLPAIQSACVQRGGCYASETSGCVVPCPAPAAPLPPVDAVPPVLTPCPPGQTPVEIDTEIVVCDPFPNGRSICAPGTAHFLGDAGCTRIGPACPSGRFPDVEPGATVVYVAQGESGVGTQASPYGTITEALADASSGDVVLVAAGRYTESFTVPVGVTVRGACVAETIVETTEKLQVAGTLENLQLDRARVDAVAPGGNGATLVNLAMYRAAGQAVRLDVSTGLRLENVLIQDSEAAGIVAWRGYVSLQRVIVASASSHGILANGARYLVEDLVVDGTRLSDGVSRAIGVQGDASFEGDRVWLGNGFDLALFVDRATAEIDDVVIRDTEESGPGKRDGRGVLVQNGADVLLRRAWLHRNTGHAIRSQAEVTLFDSVVTQTGGVSVFVESTGALTAGNVAILDSGYHAVQSSAANTMLVNLIVRRTGSTGVMNQHGHAVIASGRVSINVARFEDLAGAGVVATGTTDALGVSDLMLIRPSRAGCRVCTGVCTKLALGTVLERVEVVDAAGMAIGQIDLIAGSVHARDVKISNVGRIECDHAVASASGGLGDGFVTRGDLDLERFEISGCVGSGLSIGAYDDPSGVKVRDGFLHDNDVGMALLFTPPDEANVLTRVKLESNRIALGAP